MTDIDKLELKTLLEIHVEKTNSEKAQKILSKFDDLSLDHNEQHRVILWNPH